MFMATEQLIYNWICQFVHHNYFNVNILMLMDATILVFLNIHTFVFSTSCTNLAKKIRKWSKINEKLIRLMMFGVDGCNHNNKRTSIELYIMQAVKFIGRLRANYLSLYVYNKIYINLLIIIWLKFLSIK